MTRTPDQQRSTLAPLREEKSPYNLPQTARDGARRRWPVFTRQRRRSLQPESWWVWNHSVARMTACWMSDFAYLKLNTVQFKTRHGTFASSSVIHLFLLKCGRHVTQGSQWCYSKLHSSASGFLHHLNGIIVCNQSRTSGVSNDPAEYVIIRLEIQARNVPLWKISSANIFLLRNLTLKGVRKKKNITTESKSSWCPVLMTHSPSH